jgi:hypothetical protein
MTDTKALAVVEQPQAITRHDQALLRPIARPAEVLSAMSETRVLLRDTLAEGIDYGVIPGTDKGRDKGPPKKALLKPGAEKIAAAFGCRADYEIVTAEVDHDRVTRRPSEWVEAPQPSRPEQERLKAEGKGRSRKVNGEWVWQVKGQGESISYGLYRFVVRCSLARFDGVVVGNGMGVCSTMESKYISRPSECENTALKMAMKRALVAAVLGTFGLSEAFTQDVGDDEDDEDVRLSERREAAPAPPPPPPPPPPPKPVDLKQVRDRVGALFTTLEMSTKEARVDFMRRITGKDSGFELADYLDVEEALKSAAAAKVAPDEVQP